MGQINTARVIVGGLVAGVVINIFESVLNGVVLAKQWEEVMRGLGKTPTFSGSQILGFIGTGFATGLFLVWLYAAIRSRYGAGPKTAMCAGLAVWFIGYVLPNIGFLIMDLFPASLLLTGTAVGLIETLAAGLAGGALYKESGEASAAPPAHA